ncbi:hypothetical protein Tco_0003035 [Tanacetum coccineum]
MPHYHAVDATKAVRPILGEYYKSDNTPALKAFWRETKECIYAEPDDSSEHKGVYWHSKILEGMVDGEMLGGGNV